MRRTKPDWARCYSSNDVAMTQKSIALAAILAIGYSVAFGQSYADRSVLLVGSWNIGQAEEGSVGDLKLMVNHLTTLKLDVLALNHLDGDTGLRNGRLDEIFGAVNEVDGHDWQYILFRTRLPPIEPDWSA